MEFSIFKGFMSYWVSEYYEKRTQTLYDAYIKLSNLPFTITVYNLKEVIEQTRAKICVLPRIKGNYTRQRYAYVNFENDEDMIKAIDQQFEIKGCKLYWVEAE